MASLWRVLALSWLGGVASPIMQDDPAIAGNIAPTAVVITQPAGELPTLDAIWTESAGEETEGLPLDLQTDR